MKTARACRQTDSYVSFKRSIYMAFYLTIHPSVVHSHVAGGNN